MDFDFFDFVDGGEMTPEEIVPGVDDELLEEVTNAMSAEDLPTNQSEGSVKFGYTIDRWGQPYWGDGTPDVSNWPS